MVKVDRDDDMEEVVQQLNDAGVIAKLDGDDLILDFASGRTFALTVYIDWLIATERYG